jgi:hypothetical protein
VPFKPDYPGEIPSLGWAVVDWMEEYLHVPAGEHEGDPVRFTPSQVEFYVRLFRVQEPYGLSRYYRRAARIGVKGTGKSPSGAFLGLALIGAPVVPDGFDAYGRPVGRPQPSPLVQIAGVAEAQADNVYGLIERMVGAGGRLFDAIPNLDIGQTRINIGSTTVMTPVSSNAGTREGQPVTGGILEETQHWFQSNGGKKLFGVIKRNVGKTNGIMVELSNAPEPGAGSVAEATILGVRNKIDTDVFLDYVEAKGKWDWNDRAQRREHMREVYQDTLIEKGGWVDLDRQLAESFDSTTDESDAKRYYGNIMAAGSGAWLQDGKQRDCIDKTRKVQPGDMITMGFDGSRTGDSTALRGRRVSDNHAFTIGVWERPYNLPENTYWEVPTQEVKAAFRLAMNTYKVVRAYCDPPYWQDELALWAGEWPDEVIAFATSADTKMALALERLHTDIVQGVMTFDDDSRAVVHYGNAYKRLKGSADKPLVLIKKERPESPRKIDIIMADALAGEARADAIEAGLPEEKPADYYLGYED